MLFIRATAIIRRNPYINLYHLSLFIAENSIPYIYNRNESNGHQKCGHSNRMQLLVGFEPARFLGPIKNTLTIKIKYKTLLDLTAFYLS